MDARHQNFLSINSYEFTQQLNFALQSDQEIALEDVTATTEVGAARTTDMVGNTEALVALQTERATPVNDLLPETALQLMERGQIAIQ